MNTMFLSFQKSYWFLTASAIGISVSHSSPFKISLRDNLHSPSFCHSLALFTNPKVLIQVQVEVFLQKGKAPITSWHKRSQVVL